MPGERMGDEQERLPASPSASPVVRLELSILAADLAATESTPDASARAGQLADRSSRAQRSVVVITTDVHSSRYIAQCLGARDEVRPVIADPAALESERNIRPSLIIADVAQRAVLLPHPDVPAILIVDELRDVPAEFARQRVAPLRLLTRPFNARALQDNVDALLRGI